MSGFFDDLHVIAHTFQEYLSAWQIILQDMQSLDFRLNLGKLELYPKYRKKILGLLVDRHEGVIYIPEKKLQKIKLLSEELLLKPRVTPRELSGLTGLLVSCMQACAAIRLFNRSLNSMVAQGAGVENQGWDTPMAWWPEARVEIQFLRDMLPVMHGRAYTPNTAWITMRTIGDASGDGAGAVLWGAQSPKQTRLGTSEKVPMQWRWSPEEEKFHINVKETLTYLRVLLSHAEIHDVNLYCLTDSQVACTAMAHLASSSEEILQVVRAIWGICLT